MKAPNDLLHRFQLDRAGVRGAFVRLERSWQDLRSNGDYPGPLGDQVSAMVDHQPHIAGGTVELGDRQAVVAKGRQRATA